MIASPDLLVWLQERTALGSLSPTVLAAIAQVIEEQILPANSRLVEEDSVPTTLYILISGQVESECSNPNKTVAAYGLLPGSVINLQELLLDRPAQCAIATLTECHLWAIPAAKFQQLVGEYPEITQTFSRQLAEELVQLSSALN